MKRTIGVSLLCLAVLTLTMTAFAADKNGTVTSKDGRITTAPKGSTVEATFTAPEGLTFIYNTISSYPLGSYWCCEGYTLSGPTSLVANTFADGMPFTPSANYTVTEIVVGVGNVSGTNSIQVELDADNNGLPGATLTSFYLVNEPIFGTCCTYQFKSTLSVPVTAGTQYWVVLAPGASDTWAAWNDNVTNETSQPFAFYDNGVWEGVEGDLADFAVLGH